MSVGFCNTLLAQRRSCAQPRTQPSVVPTMSVVTALLRGRSSERAQVWATSSVQGVPCKSKRWIT